MPPRDSKPIGSLRPRGPGRWQSQIRRPGTNHTVSETWHVATQAEARKLHAQWVADVIGNRVGPAGPALEDHLTLWLRRQQHKPATERAYRHAIRNVCQHIGQTKLRDVTPRLLDDTLAEIACTHSQAVVSMCRTVLRMALSWAVVRGEIHTNPMIQLGRTVSKNRPEARQPVTTGQMLAIIGAETRPMWRTFWITLAGTGARQSELSALLWGDIDMHAGTISISKTMTVNTAGRPVVGATTKNPAGVRHVPIKPSVVAALREWRQELSAVRLHLAGPNQPVFISQSGGRTNVEVVRRAWRRALVEAGIEDNITPHSVRHWAASSMLRAGQDPHLVAKILGHSVAQLMNLYGTHIPVGTERAALDGLPDVGVGIPS